MWMMYNNQPTKEELAEQKKKRIRKKTLNQKSLNRLLIQLPQMIV